MYLVREITYCKPGKVKPMVQRSLAMAKLMEKYNQGKMRVLTDFAGDRYWMIVVEFEVQNLDAIMSMDDVPEEAMKEMEELMKGYHEFVDHGRREIFRIEG